MVSPCLKTWIYAHYQLLLYVSSTTCSVWVKLRNLLLHPFKHVSFIHIDRLLELIPGNSCITYPGNVFKSTYDRNGSQKSHKSLRSLRLLFYLYLFDLVYTTVITCQYKLFKRLSQAVLVSDTAIMQSALGFLLILPMQMN